MTRLTQPTGPKLDVRHQPTTATALSTVVPVTYTFSSRLYYLHTRYGRWKQRAQQIDAVASLPGALLITLTKPTDDDAGEAARLSIIPPTFAGATQSFIQRLRRAGAIYALRLCSRATNRLWLPHTHGLVAGLSPTRLERFAKRSGLTIHAEPLVNPQAAGRYILSSKQAKPHDRSPCRTFWANAKKLGSSPGRDGGQR